VCHAIESYGLGALLALVLLVLLRIVDASTPPIDVACKIALEAIPLSIGVSVANTQFAASGGIGSDNNGHEQPGHPVLTEAGLTVAGAIVFAGNVAPTEEIMLLATRATAAHLLALIAFSLLLSYGLIFVAEFSGLQARRGAKGLLQSPWGETLLAYALSLLVTLGLLYAFHDVSLAESPYTTAAALVVLGLPAVVGGAAGRLLVGGAQQQA
jgi:putative integral membrane protein (TIGR02587 family)